MYEVIAKFKDTDGKIYKKGDQYEGKKERVEQLSTKKNKYKKPFIKKAETPSGKSKNDKK